jgi:prepilin-type N-terminal cleavage/methylation domain-containing protein
VLHSTRSALPLPCVGIWSSIRASFFPLSEQAAVLRISESKQPQKYTVQKVAAGCTLLRAISWLSIDKSLHCHVFFRGMDLVPEGTGTAGHPASASQGIMTNLNGSRAGFTLIETLVVVMLAGIILGMATPAVGRMLVQVRIERAATVVASDMRMAASIAALQRRPVRIEVSAEDRAYEVRDHLNGTVYVRRSFAGADPELQLSSLATTATQIVVFPNGLSSGDVSLTVRLAGDQRQIVRTRAGHVRVTS